MAQRLTSIQCLRGVAALLVVLVHGFDLVDTLSNPAARSIVDRFWLIDDLGASGVDLFFVLSGFVMALGVDRYVGKRGWSRFLRARAIRILPLFWFLCALLSVRLVVGGALLDPHSLANAVTLLPLADGHEFHAPPLWVGWTLAFEVGFYLIVALATRTARPRTALLVGTTAVGIIGMFVDPWWAAARIIVNPIILEFAMGVAICLYWRRGVPALVAALAMPAGLILLVGLRAALPNLIFSPKAGLVIDGSTSLVRAAMWGMPWALVVLGAVTYDRASPRSLLARCGDASYSIYLTHALLMVEAERWRLAETADPRLVVALFCVASVVAGMGVCRFIEKPLLRCLAPRPGDRSASQRADLRHGTPSPALTQPAAPPLVLSGPAYDR